MRIINELSDTIKALAKKAGKEKDAEKLWKKAVKITEEEKGIKEKDFKDKDFAYTTGVFKNMLGLKESKLKEEFINLNIGIDRKDMGTRGTSIEKELDKLGVYYDNDGGNDQTYNINAGFNSEREANSFIKKYKHLFDYYDTESFDESKKEESKVQSFLECDMDARTWLETQLFPTEDEIDETMVSGSATSVGLPSKPMKIDPPVEEEAVEEKDDRDLIVDDREPLDK